MIAFMIRWQNILWKSHYHSQWILWVLKINRKKVLITSIIIWQNMVRQSYNYSLLLPQLYSWINERNNDSHYMMLYLHMIILRLYLRDTLTKKMKIRTVLYSWINESCNDSHYTMLYFHMIIPRLYLWDTLTKKLKICTFMIAFMIRWQNLL